MTEASRDGAAAPEELVLLRDVGGVRTLTLNRPRARNALSAALMGALQERLEEASADSGVRVLVLAGAGPVFSAGHDLKELRAGAGEGCPAIFQQCGRLMTTIVRMPEPVIAKVHGPATAAGCQLVAACDLAVATPDAWFATPGVDIGLFCSTPAVALARSVARKPAMEMLLTAERVPAERAREIGLVNRVVPADRLDDEVAELAATIAAKSPAVVALGKETFYRQIEQPLEEAYALTAEIMARNLRMEDAGEGIDAFFDKRPPDWRGR